MGNTNSTKATKATWPVAYTESEAKLMWGLDRYLFGNKVTTISLSGNMETIDALCHLYGDVTLLQVHYTLEMFKFRAL